MVRLFKGKTPEIIGSNKKKKANSIATLEQIQLGGLDQWILIRGHNVDNPLLLFLHGGPGSPEMAAAHKFDRNLEQYFTIVNWDQRGGGKSFSRKISKESMKVDQFLSDAHELIQYLLKRFNKEKIVLVGHSWGSYLGILLVRKYPELFSVYVGIGQVINIKENERLSHQYTLEEAKKRGNKKAVKQLTKLEPPYDNNLKQLNKQRKWLNKFGGALHNQTSIWPLVKIMLKAPEYTIKDIFKYLRGSSFSLQSLWTEYVDCSDVVSIASRLSVPIYLFAGRYDYNTPFVLVEDFYRKLQAPKKEFIWFEHSAHSPNFEEREKFDEIMIKNILKECNK